MPGCVGSNFRRRLAIPGQIIKQTMTMATMAIGLKPMRNRTHINNVHKVQAESSRLMGALLRNAHTVSILIMLRHVTLHSSIMPSLPWNRPRLASSGSPPRTGSCMTNQFQSGLGACALACICLPACLPACLAGWLSLALALSRSLLGACKDGMADKC